MKAQGHSIDELPFQAVLGVWGSYFGLIMNILCVIAQFYIAVAPIGATATAYNFFVQMLALPVILACFVGWKVWHRTRFVRASEMDLLTGRREMDLAAAKEEERIERAGWPMWKKYPLKEAFLIYLGSIIGSVERILLRFRVLDEIDCIDEVLLLIWNSVVCSNTKYDYAKRTRIN
jgi:hypothetical protein